MRSRRDGAWWKFIAGCLILAVLVMVSGCTLHRSGNTENGDHHTYLSVLGTKRSVVTFDPYTSDPALVIDGEDNMTGVTKLYRTYSTAQIIKDALTTSREIIEGARAKDIEVQRLDNAAAEVSGDQAIEQIQATAAANAVNP